MTAEAVLPATPIAADEPGPDQAGPVVRHRRTIVASAVAIVIAAVPFLLALWNFGIRPTRTAVPTRIFSQFYDIQARAFLDGDLHVPDGSLGLEAFRRDGHEYLYFGPLPSILRLPIVMVTDSLFGRLTAPSMALAWCVAAVFVAAIVWRVRALVTPDRPVGRADLVAAGLLIVVVMGGSPALIIAAMPWVYSEALMWALATSLGALFGLIGVLERPSVGRIVFTGLLTLAAVLSRVTAGWGTGLAVVGVAVLFAVAPGARDRRRWAGPLFVAGALPLAVGMAVNWAKFRHPVLLPFEDQAWTDLSARRRQVLAEGGVTGARFLPSTLVNYLRPDGIRLTSLFPFVSAPADPAPAIGGVNLDMRYRTPSATASMPALFAVGLYGALRIVRPGAGRGLAALRIPLAGAVSILGGMLLVGYIAPRYLVEFLPALTIAAAAGSALLLERAGQWPVSLRRTVGGAVAAGAAFGVLANLAVAGVTARIATGGESLRQLVEIQEAVAGWTGRASRVAGDGASLAERSAADEVLIVGECDAAYYGTGDLYEPWIPFEHRDLHLDVTWLGGQGAGRVELVRFDGYVRRAVYLEFEDWGFYRLRLWDARDGFVDTFWYRSRPGLRISIEVTADLERGTFVVDAPGHFVRSVPASDVRPDLHREPVVVRPAALAEATLDRINIDVAVDRGRVPELCGRLADG